MFVRVGTVALFVETSVVPPHSEIWVSRMEGANARGRRRRRGCLECRL